MKKTKNETEVTVIAPEQAREVASVETFITKAIETNVPVETMEKLFALRERVMAEQAKGAFIQALANFQKACPVIKKDKRVMNKDGSTVRYTYAPMDSIVSQIREPLAQNGISYSWEVKNETGFITAIAVVKHTLGHTETSEFKIPIDTEGYMTAPQKYASALTFAKRYSLLNALGIATGDEDTDATDVNKEKEPKSEKAKIVFLLRKLKYPNTTKIEVIDSVKKATSLDLDEKNYGEIVGRLEECVKEKEEYESSIIQ